MFRLSKITSVATRHSRLLRVANKPAPNKASSSCSRCSYSSSSSKSSSSSAPSSPNPSNGTPKFAPGGKSGHTTSGPVTFLSLGLMFLAGGGLLSYYQIEKENRAKKVASEVSTTGKAALGGPWSLVDQDGIPRTDASYMGNYQLLYFGFTFCPDICPNELVKMGKVVEEVKKRNGYVKPIFISVDPVRDSVGQLKEYSQDFSPEFAWLTGTRDQIAEAARAYRVYFSKANENDDDEEDYLVDHSIVMYLLSPTGEFLDFFPKRMTVTDIADKIIQYSSKEKQAAAKK